MSGESTRVGVVGTGWWATQVHLVALLGNPNVKVTALADTDPNGSSRLAYRSAGQSNPVRIASPGP